MFEKIMVGFMGLMGLFFIVMFFVYMPLAFKAERDCLMRGYSEANVTYMLEAYCIKIEGATNTKVVLLDELKSDE